jgi:CBS domain containing-hemolysin-like protein
VGIVTTAEVWMLTVVAILFACSVALAVAETALTRMTATRAAALADQGRRGARTLERLVRRPETWLNPVLFTVLVCQLVQATLVGVLAERLFGAWGVVAATVVNVGLVFVVAEVAPKTWAIQHTDRAALGSARPVSLLAGFLPLRLISRGLIGLTNVLLPGKGLKEGPYASEEALLALAEAAVEEEVLEAGERDLIASILEFGDTVVREVMVPRPDMVAVPAGFRVGDVMEVVLLTGFSRLPATGESVDDVAGLVYARDLMQAERDGRVDERVESLLRPARFVPETKRADELLREMQSEQFHMAVVVDEYGGTAGLVTLEDLIEELVGEIVDEYDREEPMVEPRPDGRVRVNARLPVDELNDLLQAELPTGDWDSVGGLLFHLLGHVPAEGELAEADGWLLVADRVQGRRISRVVVEPASHLLPGADVPDRREEVGS